MKQYTEDFSTSYIILNLPVLEGRPWLSLSVAQNRYTPPPVLYTGKKI